MEQDWLTHYGIKGMKWGVRRTPEQLGHERPKKRGAAAKMAKTAVATAAVAGAIGSMSRRKHRSHEESEARVLSDEELKSRNDRMRLEKNYANLKEETRRSRDDFVREATSDVSNTLKSVKEWNDKAMAKERRKERLDLRSMTDQELRSAISRAQLERQYHDFFAKEEPISEGRQWVSDVLDMVTPVVTVAGTAVSLALGVKALRAK